MCFVISLKPQDSRSRIFMTSMQPQSENSSPKQTYYVCSLQRTGCGKEERKSEQESKKIRESEKARKWEYKKAKKLKRNEESKQESKQKKKKGEKRKRKQNWAGWTADQVYFKELSSAAQNCSVVDSFYIKRKEIRTAVTLWFPQALLSHFSFSAKFPSTSLSLAFTSLPQELCRQQ